ncbi:MAG: PASTA domain-containing protein, partial [Nocardioides sp.]|uniref:PASTA domain-containing protein n=1 Tax=Nocardioides sp. TaxID=35761 RepID=UPI0039E40857
SAGQPGTADSGGAGGAGACDVGGSAGVLGAGGAGGNGTCNFGRASGGGGGGGVYGGGGGGASSAGLGGGAGSSGFGSGASRTAIATDTTALPSISLTYTVAPHQATPTCTVPRLVGKRLKAARNALRAAHCKLGKIRRAHRGAQWVVRQKPKPGVVLPAGAKVTVKLGDRHRRKK